MNKFLKPLLWLLPAMLFTATGWAQETISSDSELLWAAWTPMRTGAPMRSATQNNISSSGWTLVKEGANDTFHTWTSVVDAKAPYVDFGTQINFGYNSNPATVVMTITLPAEMTSETPKTLLTLAGYQSTTRFHLGLKSISEAEGAVFDAGNNGTFTGNTVTVADLKPGQKVTLAIFYSSGSGITLSQINFHGAKQLANWSAQKAASNQCTRITFGADHDGNAGIAFGIHGLEVYRNSTHSTAVNFPENVCRVINSETIGLNFSRNDASAQLSTTSTELYGYQSETGDEGGFLEECAWQSVYTNNNTNPLTTGQAYAITTAGNPELNITLTKNSENSVWGPNGNKLFGSYLDNGSNLTFNGLPKTGYDVAIIFAGDGAGHISRVTVNGTDKTYDETGNLIDGSTGWGDRTTSASDLKTLTETGTSSTGQVMYLSDLTDETLTLQTYNDGEVNGRGTIAAIQIYLKDGVEAPVLDEATSFWDFEGTTTDVNGGVTSWSGDNNTTNGFVRTFRFMGNGSACRGAQMSTSLHPYRDGYAWPSAFTIMAYVDVAKCPNNGVLVSSGGSTKLRKVDSNTIRFGGPNVYVDADCADLSIGYHLIVATFSDSGLTLQIDGGAPVTNASKSAIADGLQIGAEWAGGTHSYNNDGGTIIDDLAIWNRVLAEDEIAQLKGVYPAINALLSMDADVDEDGMISKAELETAVGSGATRWNVLGDVVLSLDSDLGLTSLELRSATPTGASLRVTGAGSLYGNSFALTVENGVAVDIVNQKNNPTITLAGAGAVTIHKGDGETAGGIALVNSDYTGTLTVDGGQQITHMDGDLSLPFTMGEGGATLHSNGSNWTVTSKISGTGPLTIATTGAEWIAIRNNNNDFTGDVIVNSGVLYVGNKGGENSGTDSKLGDENSSYTVKSGATFYTHLGGSDKTFAPNIILEDGAIFGNRDGHVTYSGDIAINGQATYNFYWNKQNTFAGVVAGTGTLTINGPDNENGTCEIRLTNAENTFTGTYKLAGKNDNRKIKLVACATTGAASYNLTNAYSILSFSGDVTVNTLTGSAGSVESSDSETVRTITLTGTESDITALTVSSDVKFVVADGAALVVPAAETLKAVVDVQEGGVLKAVLTAEQKVAGITLGANLTNAGIVVFLDVDGETVLQESESLSYAPATECIYTVTNEGGEWSVAPGNDDVVTIAFGDTTEQTIDWVSIATDVTRVASLTITGTNGGTITNIDTLTANMIAVNTSVTLPAKFVATASEVSVITDKVMTLVGGTDERVDVATLITGEGRVAVTNKVTLTGANTWTGGTEIAEGAMFTITNPAALGSGNITGAGALVCNVAPTNKSGLNAEAWTGTVGLNFALGNEADFTLYGNASSTIHLMENGSANYLARAKTIASAFILDGTITHNNGWSDDGGQIFSGTFSGAGTLATSGDQGDVIQITGDTTKFTGTITVAGSHCVSFGEQSDDNTMLGKIVIAKDTIIPEGKTWTAVNGIAIKDGATLTIMDARALPTDKAITGTGTLAINGTMDLSGLTSLANFEGKIEIKAGTLTLVTGVEGDMVVPEGCTLKLNGHSDVPYVSGATGAGTIQIIAPNGDILSETGSYEPSSLSGNCTWYEFLFEGDADATRLANGGTAGEAIRGEDSGTWTFVDVGVTPARQALQIYNKYPWTNTAPTFNALETWSASCFAKMPTTEGGVLIGFGTTVGNTPGFIALVRGKGENKVLLVAGAALGAGYEILADFTVPNAEEAYHLYSFVRTATGVEIYLDGEPWAPYHQPVSVGNGFQIGSLHGGISHTYTGELTAYRGLSLARGGSESDKNGMVDMLRIYRYALSSEDIQALAAEYAYISPSGSYARTLATETSEWVATASWANSADATAEKLDVPPSGAAVTVTTEIASTVTMNLSTESIAEALTLQGSDITIVGGENSAKMNVQGLTKVICNAEIDCGVVEMTGPVRVAEGATLTLNVTESLLDAVINGKALGKFTHPLTGAAEGTIDVSVPAGETYEGWNVTVEQDGTGAYILTVTRDNWYVTITEEGSVTWAAGNTPETAGSVDVPDSALNAAITITANGDATVTLPTEMSKITIAGTGAVTLALPGEATATISSLVIGAGANVTIPQALTVTAMEIGEGATIGYAATTSGMAIAEPLTGNYNLTVVSGTVTLTGASDNAAYTGTITVKNGATLALGYGVGLPETAPIALEDGATLFAKNGAGASSTIASAITIDGAVTVKGSENGEHTRFTGAIFGTGTLTIASGDYTNKFAIDGAITGALKVVVSIGYDVTFTSNENAFTGGLEIAEGGKLTVTQPGAMGTGGVVNNGALTFAFPAEGEGGSYTDAFSGTGDYTLASGSLTWIFGADVAVDALTVSGGKMTIVPTVNNTSLGVQDAITIANGTLVIAPTATDGYNGVTLATDASVTIGNGGALAFSGETARLFAHGEIGSSAITVGQGGTIYAGVNGIPFPVTLANGSVLDLYGYGVDVDGDFLTTMTLQLTKALTLPTGENQTVTVKLPKATSFLTYTGEAIEDWASRFVFTKSDGTPQTLEGVYLVDGSVGNAHNFTFASVVEIEGMSDAVAADIAQLVATLTGGEQLEVTEVVNADAAVCFEDIAYDYTLQEEVLQSGKVTLTYGFGVGDITVVQRTVDETPSNWIAVAVKVTDGGMGYGAENAWPAKLRAGTQIQLSKDDGDSYGETALTPLTDDELTAAGLVNGEGVYWYWAETLPEIATGKTSTTVKYKVRAVNDGTAPAQE